MVLSLRGGPFDLHVWQSTVHTIIKLGYNLQKQQTLITYNFYNHNYPIVNKPLFMIYYPTWSILVDFSPESVIP